jgi:hypothetical protein
VASTKTQTPTTTTTCRPKTCPTCGSQECFERPRFFCGQLLTDRDLDAAQRYVIEKNKLHNRYLVGTGVVCGLAVRCDPCDGVVQIEPGYAIDCCGNDIVVCEAQKFDVLSYIKNCFKNEEEGCHGRIQPPPSHCDEEPREYCLVISYNELHTRPVTAMVRDNGCRPAHCEPSRTSEVFRFDLVNESDRADAGDDFFARARACLRDFLQRSQAFFDEFRQALQTNDSAARHNALKGLFCRQRDELLQIYRAGPRVRCTFREELKEVEDNFPWVTEVPQYSALVHQAMFRLYAWRLQLLIDCLCDALLVPCTQCGDEEGVLLACLTVQHDKVVKICNTARRQLLTGPSLRYWMHPLFRSVERLIEHVCCDLNLGRAFDNLFRPQTGHDTSAAPGQEQQASMFAQATENGVLRAGAALQMVGDYSAATLTSLRTTGLLQLTNPQTVTALDLYGQPAEVARQRLQPIGVKFTERRVQTEAEAYALGNLFQMAWVVAPQSDVELVIDSNDHVTCVRLREGGGR